ncbi:DUF6216 family protein [Comamonas sp. MYb21]|uniref:DUF6216 family protein n=1 Tax=Comamonas sp. MYb21 TaxID=1848648 RepID=UPI0030A7BD32
MPDISAISSEHWDWITKGLGWTIFLLTILYTWTRAGSLHFLRDKIWLILSFKRKFSDAELNKHWDEIRDIEMLRFKTGLPFSYREELDDLKTHIEKKNINIYEILSLSNYFNLKEKNFRDIAYKKWANFFFTFAILLLLTGYACFLFSLSDKVWLKINKSDTLFSYNGEVIKMEKGIISKSTCISPSANFTANSDQAIACRLLETENSVYKTFLNKQKITLIFLGFILFSIGLLILRKGIQYMKVLNISKRLSY